MLAGRRRARRLLLPSMTAVVVAVGLPSAIVARGDSAETDADRARARYTAALTDLWNGRAVEAIDPLYQLYLRRACGTLRCELRLAQAYRSLEQIDEALRWVRTAIERAEVEGAGAAEEYNELGICRYRAAVGRSGDLEPAIAALREAVRRHSGLGDTYRYNLARVLIAAGRRQEAEPILDEFRSSSGLRPVIERGEAVIGEFRRVEVLDRKYAKYTPEANRQGVEGRILLQAVIDSEGRVADTEVLQGLPHGLTEEALKALRKSTFRPARVDGKPVAGVYRQLLDMRLTPALVSQHQIAGGEHSH